MNDVELRAVRSAIASLKEPISIARLLAGAAVTYDLPAFVDVRGFLAWLKSLGPNDPDLRTLATKVALWDYVESDTWTAKTQRSTRDRRTLIVDRLALREPAAEAFEELFPRSPVVDDPIVIASDWSRWYVGSRREPSYYWNKYQAYLTERKSWHPKNIAALDAASTDVIERLSDPLGPGLKGTKGLVIGYVQSGKTANFTGVIAKAADAGYRMFVVLAGMQNILRDQTQRRIDKELLGKEFVGSDYDDAPDLSDFVTHGGLPSQFGHFDWERLTTAKEDFKQLRVGLSALSFKRADKSKPFRDPANLRHESARLVVVKKNPTALASLIRSMKEAAKHVPLHQVPSLVIDDESDQASVNTKKPTVKERKERTAINALIVELLQVLGSPQYVGYTATPFANVFIDPDDDMDLFPSDSLLSLPRPMDYMGVADFFDEDSDPPKDYLSNQKAFVRPVTGGDLDSDNLPTAIDAYVLAGAIKVYREQNGLSRFQHHTMLIHNSPRILVHDDDADNVRRAFRTANYLGGGKGVARLANLWRTDFSKVCAVRAGGAPTPPSWNALRACLGEAYRRITDGGDPVIVLNGQNTETAPDFDSTPVWRIIIGGAKLSRGYTVEGLTVSYYRRRAGAADTLMQMGRWFGFRRNYRDLVRLYIGTKEPLDKKGKRTINLYDAFHGACRDEEEFRAQLKRYGSLEPGKRITPRQIPPLVPRHMLRPSSAGKMYNAKVTFINYGEQSIERTGAPAVLAERKFNDGLARALLSGTKMQKIRIRYADADGPVAFTAATATRSPAEMLAFLTQYKWNRGQAETWPLVLEYLNGKHGKPEIDSWLIVAPQLETSVQPWAVNGTRLSVKQRSRENGGARYKVYTESIHVRVARWAAGLLDGKAGNADTAALRALRQAVMLFYPVLDDGEKLPPSMGFALYPPKNKITRAIAYSVLDPRQADAIVVPVPSAKR